MSDGTSTVEVHDLYESGLGVVQSEPEQAKFASSAILPSPPGPGP